MFCGCQLMHGLRYGVVVVPSKIWGQSPWILEGSRVCFEIQSGASYHEADLELLSLHDANVYTVIWLYFQYCSRYGEEITVTHGDGTYMMMPH